MATVLGAATTDNTRYTVFENNQVLTADQLNDLFNYLQVQERLTRARTIGVGIAGGLEIGATDNSTIVVSKGVALTTDGDLLYLDNDTAFVNFVPFEDDVAKYPLFRAGETTIPLFELLPENTQRTGARKLAEFVRATNTALTDYVGILYQEEHLHDPDLCTGTDCDNKGTGVIRRQKVLLVHKNNTRTLLAGIPRTNKEFFSLEDIRVPRVKINPNISKYDELNGAFRTALTVKDELKTKLAKAYEVCRQFVGDEFNDADPATEWGQLLEGHFSGGNTIYVQYVYDLARDLATAYNELRNGLFGNNAILCPPVDLFPKHVLLGAVRAAVITRPLLPLRDRINVNGNLNLNLLRAIRFDPEALIRRFAAVNIDVEYRHDFYPSPALLGGDDFVERIRFCFTRINALIRNFKLPTAEDMQSVRSIRITPSYADDKGLGERSIPFYYRFSRSLPLNAYWNYDANVRRRENETLWYFAGSYSAQPSVISPLNFDLLRYDFFRIEGHIGFAYTEVERMLNSIIEENNLPINLVTVQVERDLRTVPNRDWFFPHLHVYDQLVRNSFVDQLQQADLIHPVLQQQTADDEDAPRINLSIQSFNNAKAKVMNNPLLGSADFDVTRFKKDVSDVISATTEIKAQTKKFTFSNTALPHDFVINTDVLQKADLLAGLLNDQLTKKKEDLLLGNFLRKNPGLEHAGGVLRGGTFVLVYTANDNKVVADFMLPYASIDKDIVKDPIVVKPLPLPQPKFELPKIFERIPPYKKLVDDRIKVFDDRFKVFDDKLLNVDDRVSKKLVDFDDTRKLFDDKLKFIDDKAKDIDGRLSQKTSDLDATRKLFEERIGGFDARMKDVDAKFGSRIEDFDKRLDYHGKIFDDITKLTVRNAGTKGNLVVNGRDLTAEAAQIKKMRSEVSALQANTAERQAKEQQLATATNNFLAVLNQQNLAIDSDRELELKGLLFDVQDSTEVIQNPNLKPLVTNNILNVVRNLRVVFK